MKQTVLKLSLISIISFFCSFQSISQENSKLSETLKKDTVFKGVTLTPYDTSKKSIFIDVWDMIQIEYMWVIRK